LTVNGAPDRHDAVDVSQLDAIVVGIDDPDAGCKDQHDPGLVEGIGGAAALAAAEQPGPLRAAIREQGAMVVLVGQPHAIAVDGATLSPWGESPHRIDHDGHQIEPA
jgi:hypothetical protein